MSFSKLEKNVRTATGADKSLDKQIASALKIDQSDFTSSVDACLDLLNAKFPSAHWHIGRAADGVGVYAFLEDGDLKSEAESVTVPLALLTVILQGLKQGRG